MKSPSFPSSHSSKSRAPSQRQLRVGEELRHVLAGVLQRNDCSAPELDGLSITVSEVRVSPDLRHATAYVAPLGGNGGEAMIATLTKLAKAIRKEVTTRVHLKYSPDFKFKLDTSFDEAMKIHRLLQGSDKRHAESDDNAAESLPHSPS